jgi:hypothetical protein
MVLEQHAGESELLGVSQMDNTLRPPEVLVFGKISDGLDMERFLQ